MYFIQYRDGDKWRNAAYDGVPTRADAEYLLNWLNRVMGHLEMRISYSIEVQP